MNTTTMWVQSEYASIHSVYRKGQIEADCGVSFLHVLQTEEDAVWIVGRWGLISSNSRISDTSRAGSEEGGATWHGSAGEETGRVARETVKTPWADKHRVGEGGSATTADATAAVREDGYRRKTGRGHEMEKQ